MEFSYLYGNLKPIIMKFFIDTANLEQFRAVGTNYNQVVKELRLHFSEKKAMALLYKLEQQTVELVKLSRQIVELSREMEAKWSQKSV